jgi:hypothetical protein
MCHKPLTPLDAWFFCQKNYSTKRLFWGFLLAVPSNFYRTGLGLGGICGDRSGGYYKYYSFEYNLV